MGPPEWVKGGRCLCFDEWGYFQVISESYKILSGPSLFSVEPSYWASLYLTTWFHHLPILVFWVCIISSFFWFSLFAINHPPHTQGS